MSRGFRYFLVAFGVLAVLAVLSVCLGFWLPGLDIALYLPFAWIFFLKRVAPQLHVRWDLLASTALYAAALLVGSHLFLRWLYREFNKSPGGAAAAATPGRWKWRWTLGGFAIVFLMFAAGTAAVGIAHQAAWLARSPDPIYRRGGRVAAYRIKCASNLRQIGLAIQMYANDHDGRLPDDFGQLLLHADITADTFVCPMSQDEYPTTGQTLEEQAAALSTPGHCSYVYFGRGLSMPLDADRVIAIDRPANHGEGAAPPSLPNVNVLYADGRTEWVDREAAVKLLTELGFEKTERGWRDPPSTTQPTTAATATTGTTTTAPVEP